jgi:uncharacterized membrane protein YczE
MMILGNHPHRPARRLTQLLAGLALYGAGMALMVRSGLGLDPWDVLHQGLARRTGLSIGTATIALGVVVLLLWIPLRQRPGLGTVCNVALVGLTMDATLAVLPPVRPLPARVALLVVAVLCVGVASGAYLGARLGPGPRDGLMTGFVALRPGRSLRLTRTVIELSVLVTGWLLGGTVGVGTALFAVAIGPLTQVFLPLMTVDGPPRAAQDAPVPPVGTPRAAGADPTGCGPGR